MEFSTFLHHISVFNYLKHFQLSLVLKNLHSFVCIRKQIWRKKYWGF